MKHLVTGGSGFLGHLIAKKLLEAGEDVRVIDIWKDESMSKDIEFIKCDILDTYTVAKAMENIDIVHHNAALVPLTKSGDLFQTVNVDGSGIVAKAAVKAGVKAFIYMSSSSIYGYEKCPITAETPVAPIETYGQSKWGGEKLVQSICHAASLPLICVRPRTILGEGRLGIFQLLFSWIKDGANPYVMGDGNHLYQFVHVNDLIDAYMLALGIEKTGIYNVGTDRFGTMREAITHVIDIAGTTSKVKSLPVKPTIFALSTLSKLGLSPLVPWHYLTYHKPLYFDMTPLLNLGWKAKYSNNEMLEESYTWFLANYEHRFDHNNASGIHRKPVKEGILWLMKKIS